MGNLFLKKCSKNINKIENNIETHNPPINNQKMPIFQFSLKEDYKFETCLCSIKPNELAHNCIEAISERIKN